MRFSRASSTSTKAPHVHAGLCLLIAMICPACIASAAEPDFAMTFDDLYRHIGQVYPCFEMKGIDWKTVGDEMLPRAKQVRNEYDFGLLVQELVAKMEDSHAVVERGTHEVPTPELPQSDPGFACILDDRNEPVVYYVDSASNAEKVGIRPGMIVLSVNDQPAEDAIKERMATLRKYYGFSSERNLRACAVSNFFAQSQQGDIVKLSLHDVEGKTFDVQSACFCGPRYLPRLPVPSAGIKDDANVSFKKLAGSIGYIYVRRINEALEPSLDRAIDKMSPMNGLILDVRGNSGGGFDAQSALRNFKSPTEDPQDPDRPRYTGKIALLLDERTISAGEGWASWFIANHRARTFGATTAGASSRKEEYTLLNGYYKVIIPVKSYNGFLDRPIERRGLEPDVRVRCTAADIAAGRDTVITRARDWLRSK